jgi:hypothetical protein
LARKGVEHNRLLLAYNMMKSGLGVFEAWKRAGDRIKRSKAQLNRRKRFGDG